MTLRENPLMTIEVKEKLVNEESFEMLKLSQINPIFALNLLNVIMIVNFVWNAGKKNIGLFHKILLDLNIMFSYMLKNNDTEIAYTLLATVPVHFYELIAEKGKKCLKNKFNYNSEFLSNDRNPAQIGLVYKENTIIQLNSMLNEKQTESPNIMYFLKKDVSTELFKTSVLNMPKNYLDLDYKLDFCDFGVTEIDYSFILSDDIKMQENLIFNKVFSNSNTSRFFNSNSSESMLVLNKDKNIFIEIKSKFESKDVITKLIKTSDLFYSAYKNLAFDGIEKKFSRQNIEYYLLYNNKRDEAFSILKELVEEKEEKIEEDKIMNNKNIEKDKIKNTKIIYNSGYVQIASIVSLQNQIRAMDDKMDKMKEEMIASIEKEKGEMKASLEKEKGEMKASLEKEKGEMKASLEKEKGEMKASIEKEKGEMKASLEKEKVEMKASLEKEKGEMKASLEKEKVEMKASLEKEKGEMKASLEKEKGEMKASLEKEKGEMKASLEKEKGEMKASLEKEKVEMKASFEKEKEIMKKEMNDSLKNERKSMKEEMEKEMNAKLEIKMKEIQKTLSIQQKIIEFTLQNKIELTTIQDILRKIEPVIDKKLFDFSKINKKYIKLCSDILQIDNDNTILNSANKVIGKELKLQDEKKEFFNLISLLNKKIAENKFVKSYYEAFKILLTGPNWKSEYTYKNFKSLNVFSTSNFKNIIVQILQFILVLEYNKELENCFFEATLYYVFEISRTDIGCYNLFYTYQNKNDLRKTVSKFIKSLNAQNHESLKE